jgi:hypothetical protein
MPLDGQAAMTRSMNMYAAYTIGGHKPSPMNARLALKHAKTKYINYRAKIRCLPVLVADGLTIA